MSAHRLPYSGCLGCCHRPAMHSDGHHASDMFQSSRWAQPLLGVREDGPHTCTLITSRPSAIVIKRVSCRSRAQSSVCACTVTGARSLSWILCRLCRCCAARDTMRQTLMSLSISVRIPASESGPMPPISGAGELPRPLHLAACREPPCQLPAQSRSEPCIQSLPPYRDMAGRELLGHEQLWSLTATLARACSGHLGRTRKLPYLICCAQTPGSASDSLLEANVKQASRGCSCIADLDSRLRRRRKAFPHGCCLCACFGQRELQGGNLRLDRQRAVC